MSEWQPIATAPKDESFVLLYVPHQQLETGPVVMGMHWRDEQRDDAGKFKKGRWYHVGNGWLGVEADLRPAWCEPTHWMPLPAPPNG